ncbi:MAG TPA: hypothetical protein VK401_13235 [Propionibacteriaceae bacterium]|jgi:hypothetical protein|nr:hypothetical protein [Propionibacteriaceae bacterium]
MSISTTISERLTTIRSQVRERRQERAEHRALERDLAGYRTQSEIDELLVVLGQHEGREAQEVRDILLQNSRPTPPLFRAA